MKVPSRNGRWNGTEIGTFPAPGTVVGQMMIFSRVVFATRHSTHSCGLWRRETSLSSGNYFPRVFATTNVPRRPTAVGYAHAFRMARGAARDTKESPPKSDRVSVPWAPSAPNRRFANSTIECYSDKQALGQVGLSSRFCDAPRHKRHSGTVLGEGAADCKITGVAHGWLKIYPDKRRLVKIHLK